MPIKLALVFFFQGGMNGLQNMMKQFQQGGAGGLGKMFGGMGGDP